MEHRGRVQAQGGGLEASEAWAQMDPLPVSRGHELLNHLRAKIGPREAEIRDKPFAECHDYMDRLAAVGGGGANTSKSVYVRRGGDRRVDFEIKKGVACVPDPT